MGANLQIASLAIAKELWDVSPINLAEGVKVALGRPPSPKCDGHELKLHLSHTRSRNAPGLCRFYRSLQLPGGKSIDHAIQA
ncbi:hypothetical protein ABIB66_006011 [Bradyrhizobium sp. F1.13.3]